MNTFTAANPIAFTKVRAPWGWLGNMSPHPVFFLTQHSRATWPTTEHLFQAMRLPKDHPAVAAMLKSSNPMAAKMTAKAAKDDFIVAPLSEEDLANMRAVLACKIEKHPDLRLELMASEDRVIIEDVSSRRNKGSAMFWGAAYDGSHWTGDNWLGVLWMELRSKLRA